MRPSTVPAQSRSSQAKPSAPPPPETCRDVPLARSGAAGRIVGTNAMAATHDAQGALSTTCPVVELQHVTRPPSLPPPPPDQTRPAALALSTVSHG
eukprot:scaffold16733_cov112-Isochrysis_galbana.AAC.2